MAENCLVIGGYIDLSVVFLSFFGILFQKSTTLAIIEYFSPIPICPTGRFYKVTYSIT